MDATVHCTEFSCPQGRSPHSRRFEAEKLDQFSKLDSPWNSRRQIARQIDVSDRTLYRWIDRSRNAVQTSSWPGDVARLFQTPDGLDFLHGLVAAAHLVFVQANDCGIRSLCWFLELSGLDEFVSPSFGAQQAVAEEMESLLVTFGQEEDQRLAASMPAPRSASAKTRLSTLKSAWWASNPSRTSSSWNSMNRNGTPPLGTGVWTKG